MTLATRYGQQLNNTTPQKLPTTGESIDLSLPWYRYLMFGDRSVPAHKEPRHTSNTAARLLNSPAIGLFDPRRKVWQFTSGPWMWT